MRVNPFPPDVYGHSLWAVWIELLRTGNKHGPEPIPFTLKRKEARSKAKDGEAKDPCMYRQCNQMGQAKVYQAYIRGKGCRVV